MSKEIVECPYCGMSNLIIFDTILPRLNAHFVCSDCDKEYCIYGDITIKLVEV